MTNEILEVSDKTPPRKMTELDWQLFKEAAEHEASPQELEEYEKLQIQMRKREKHFKRLKDCGNFAYWFDPHSGKRSGFVLHCDLFRECPSCLQRRATREYQWMKYAVITKHINFVRMDDRQKVNNMVRGLDKTQYVRYPLVDGTEIIFLDANERPDTGEKAESLWLSKQDWAEIVTTPEGRNKSGTLHIPSSPEEEEAFTIITAKQFVTEAPINLVEETADQVVADTDYMRPENPQEVRTYLNRRLNMTVKKLREQGHECRVYHKKLKVIHSRIDWGGDMPNFSVEKTFDKLETADVEFPGNSIKHVNTKNLTSQGTEKFEKPPRDDWGW